MIAANRLAVVYLRPMTLSVDEMLVEFVNAVQRVGAKRVVIDSLSGFEIALAPTFRLDFRESLYRLVGALTATGVTVLMTAEVIEAFPEVRFTNERVSFVTDDIHRTTVRRDRWPTREGPRGRQDARQRPLEGFQTL